MYLCSTPSYVGGWVCLRAGTVVLRVSLLQPEKRSIGATLGANRVRRQRPHRRLPLDGKFPASGAPSLPFSMVRKCPRHGEVPASCSSRAMAVELLPSPE